MSTVQAASLVDKFGLETSAENNFNKDLGQDEFLEIMMAQLKHQDPMKPMENGEFLGQMAQFSTVSGIEEMQQSLDTMTSTFNSQQTLQSTQLVGHEVLVENNSMSLDTEGSTGGSFELDATSGNVKMDITDSSGKVVRQMSLGEFVSGRHDFSWDGLSDQGERMPPGNYNVSITASDGEAFTSATVLTPRVIDSVEFGSGSETTLNTRQGDVLSMADIRQIRQAVGSTTNSTEQ